MPQIEKRMTYSDSSLKTPKYRFCRYSKFADYFTEKFAGGVNWNSAQYSRIPLPVMYDITDY